MKPNVKKNLLAVFSFMIASVSGSLFAAGTGGLPGHFFARDGRPLLPHEIRQVAGVNGFKQAESLAVPASTSEQMSWARFYDDGGVENFGIAAADSDGNVYATGTSLSSTCMRCNFISRYDRSGNLLWTKKIAAEYGFTAAVVDNTGNLVMTGWKQIADPVTGILTTGGLTAKFDPDGNTLWESIFNEETSEDLRGITVDEKGNIFAAGDGNRLNPATGLLYGGALVVKYDTDGNYIWNTFYDTAETGKFEVIEDIAVDAAGNLTVAGYKSWNNPKSGLLNSSGLIISFDSNGKFNWKKENASGPGDADGNIFDKFYSVEVDNNGNIYTGGTRAWIEVTGFINGGWIVKYDHSGNLIWDNFYDSGKTEWFREAAMDWKGNLYLAGYQYSEDPATGLLGDLNAVLIKFDANGNFKSETLFDRGQNELFNSISVDPNGNIFAAGSTGDIENRYNEDGLLVKYGLNTGMFRILPGTTSLLYTQSVDVGLVYKGTETITGLKMLLDGVDISGSVVLTGRPGTLESGGHTWRLPGVSGSRLGAGRHNIYAEVSTPSGITAASTVYEVEPNKEP